MGRKQQIIIMSIKYPPFSFAQLESIAKVLGDTEIGLTGTEIGLMLANSQIPDLYPTLTKWKRLYNAFIEIHNKTLAGNNVIKFITLAMSPERYVQNKEIFDFRQMRLNRILSLIGLELQEEGKLHRVKKAETLSDAVARASLFRSKLEQRNIHPDILKFATAEIIKDNYFHAVLESIKSITTKIREITGYYADGQELVEMVFLGRNPELFINEYKTFTQMGEQKGFANLLKGLYGTFRNPLAHEAKINWEMSEQDALDILSTISLVHRKLDKARR